MMTSKSLNDYAVVLADGASSEQSKSEAAEALATAGYSQGQIDGLRDGYYAGAPEAAEPQGLHLRKL